MRRFASVWLPAWPIERMRRADPDAVPDDRPLALVEAGARGIVVVAVNLLARGEGIRPGQSLADARAIFPGLLTRKIERDKDQAALVALARWSGRYGPARNSDGDKGLWIDVTGVPHLFGGEHHLMRDLAGRLRAFGLTVRAGLADTRLAATALARFAPVGAEGFAIAPAGQMQGALAGLPVEALGLEDEAVLLLKRLGLRRIGQLYELPRAALARRFRELRTGRRRTKDPADLAGVVLARLDAALGQAPEARCVLSEPPRYIARRVFSEPLISAEGIESAVTELAADLCKLLDQTAHGARRLQLCLYRVDGTMAEVRAGTSKPCREPIHLLKLLAPKVSTIDAGFGVDVLTLEAASLEQLDPTQASLSAGLDSDARGDPTQLIDKLANRLGAERVVRLARFSSHIPEQAEVRIPILTAKELPKTRFSAQESCMRGAIRPLLLFATPEPITVLAEVPEGPPARFTWRRVSHTVAKAEGPERIEPEWWRTIGNSAKPPRPRDYYRIEDDRGGRYWVFREGLYDRTPEAGPPVWYMHGLFG
jgi:protein ImuB